MNRHDDDIRIMEKVKQIVKNKLPGFASRYFNDNRDKKVPRTLYGYALDLTSFFEYLESVCKPISEMTLDDLNCVTSQTIEDYMEHIRTYIQNGSRKETSAAGQHRKYSSLSSFFNYYYKLGLIDQHPVHRVAAPKPPRHTTEVPTNEINYEMLDFVANGNLSGREANFREHTKERDLAIIMLIIGAGIKFSDLVNIDIDDIHLEDNSITLRSRKCQRTVYISNTVADALGKYLAQRLEIVAQLGDEQALFLSLQCKRIGVRGVQKIYEWRRCDRACGRVGSVLDPFVAQISLDFFTFTLRDAHMYNDPVIPFFSDIFARIHDHRCNGFSNYIGVSPFT